MGATSSAMEILSVVLGGLYWLCREALALTVEYPKPSIGLVAALALYIAIRRFRRRRSKEQQPATQVLTPVPQTPKAPPIGWTAARWVPAGQGVEVRGIRIPRGQFYLGQQVLFPDGRATDQYAINLDLPIARSAPDVAGSTMPYWPSYARITPQARLAFVRWLAGGRSDPACGIGHVFIFLYGLEHRIFVERDIASVTAAIDEVRRLLSIYGSNGSFRGYASRFMNCAIILAGLPVKPPRPAANLAGHAEMPLSVRLHLGAQLAVSGVFDSGDALLWYLASTNKELRTSVVRCFEEFERLWHARFRTAFPQGLPVATTGRIAISYRSASGAFNCDIPGPHTSHPDLAGVPSPARLLKFGDECAEALAEFSRFVGRHPERRSSLQAALLLPPEIGNEAFTNASAPLKEQVDALMGSRSTALVGFAELARAAGISTEGDKLPSGAIGQLGRLLDAIDIAVEPDARYGSGSARPEEEVVIFRAAAGAPIDSRRPAYSTMKTKVEVGALAAAADGEGTTEELQAVIATIRGNESLREMERLRLIAYAVTLFRSPPRRQRFLKRLSEVSQDQREAIARTAAAVVAGSGMEPDPKSVAFVERVNKSLGLDPGRAHADLHRAAAAIATDQPVPMSTEVRTPGIRLPKDNSGAAAPKLVETSSSPKESEESLGIRIDLRRLEAVKRDTDAVRRTLSGIFSDEETEAAPASAKSASAPSAFAGLDAGHAELLIYLAGKGEVERADFEQKAKSLKLLPDGAIERINDWSFDRFDGPLLEDGEQVAIQADMRSRVAELTEQVHVQ